jgi:NADPH-dependent 2,4-dienoyl-CoA reductase/sulfur reductase-like enzyme/predicted acylesterase/phospholipase RssA
MVKIAEFLLIGGGLASATAAEALREEGADGKIAIISAEDSLPYHRPPLTKGFLLGNQKKEAIFVLKEHYYREQKIDVLLGTRAIAVHPGSKRVETDHAGEFQYNKLLIATGCSLKKLDVPGADLSGIFYLRTIADAEALKRAMSGAKKAVVVGASFIGMELASSFAKSGIRTTIIAQENLVFDKLDSPTISEFFIEYYKSHGVEIVLGETIKEFKAKDQTGSKGSLQVKSVVTSAAKTFLCDIVAIGIGVSPDVDFLRGSGLKLDDGILVNQYMETNKPDIYAAGDVANFFDPTFRKYRRIEHWDNAIRQGQIAAKNMMGQRQHYHVVSYFFSDVFDLSFNVFGCTADANERILRGSTKDKSFSLLYLKDAAVRAIFSLELSPTETKAAESLILNNVSLKGVKEKLLDKTFLLEKVAVQTVLILQGGGALGAFECGVIKAMEEKKIYPDIVAGVSIGSFNAAIIAGNPKNASAALEAFWDELTMNTPDISNQYISSLVSSVYILTFGSPKFFRPRWLMPISRPEELPLYWTSFYDPYPVKNLLNKYVDFEKLVDSPIRLFVSAVNVETSELTTFDSYTDDITPDHILASGSLPPGFPWTTIDGKHYWDGGIVSNSPLDQLIELLGSAGKKVYIVDLYPTKKPLPRNIMEVLARRDEIFYSEKIDRNIHSRELIDNYKRLVEEMMGYLEPGVVEQIKHRPVYIRTMGDAPPVSITRIVREGEGGEPASKDYDFSRKSIEEHEKEGYRIAKRILEKEEDAEMGRRK